MLKEESVHLLMAILFLVILLMFLTIRNQIIYSGS